MKVIYEPSLLLMAALLLVFASAGMLLGQSLGHLQGVIDQASSERIPRPLSETRERQRYFELGLTIGRNERCLTHSACDCAKSCRPSKPVGSPT
jgi:hypothetical protein